jgi:hypothetical protein
MNKEPAKIFANTQEYLSRLCSAKDEPLTYIILNCHYPWKDLLEKPSLLLQYHKAQAIKGKNRTMRRTNNLLYTYKLCGLISRTSPVRLKYIRRTKVVSFWYGIFLAFFKRDEYICMVQ